MAEEIETSNLILSDVHANCRHHKEKHLTRFEYVIPDTNELKNEGRRSVFQMDVPTESTPEGEICGVSIAKDADGDYEVRRKKKAVKKDCIVIEHSLGTTLDNVGLQVWQAALLLCDFILDNHEAFKSCCCLELGGGVGLTSITMATVADIVICTDVGLQILDTCQNNIDRNCVNEQTCKPIVRELDWTIKQGIENRKCSMECSSRFHWQDHELSFLSKLDFIIAADVIYDNKLTEAFFNKLFELMCGSKSLKAVYIATEKRLNFTLEDLDVTCKEYDVFQSCLSALRIKGCHGNNVQIEQVSVDWPQRFSYQRTKQLELWKIQPVK